MEAAVKNLMFDLSSGREIFDEETGRVVSKAEANDKLRQICFEILGLDEKSTEKQIKRALKSQKGVEFFEVIEEQVEKILESGWKDSEFFNDFVETRNLADGDRTDFTTKQDIILNISKISGDHHYLEHVRVRIA